MLIEPVVQLINRYVVGIEGIKEMVKGVLEPCVDFLQETCYHNIYLPRGGLKR